MSIKIEEIKRRGSRVEIKVSSLSEPIIISETLLVQLKLVEGTILTEAQLEQLQQKAMFLLCEKEGARLLLMRDYSIGEFRLRLQRKQFDKKHIEEVISNCKKQGLLDDERYAYRLATQLADRRPCGLSYMKAYLVRRRINSSIAHNIAEMILSKQSESDRALSALESKWRQYNHFELEVARRKAYNYLSRRGFGYQASKEAFEQMIKQQAED